LYWPKEKRPPEKSSDDIGRRQSPTPVEGGGGHSDNWTPCVRNKKNDGKLAAYQKQVVSPHEGMHVLGGGNNTSRKRVLREKLLG